MSSSNDTSKDEPKFSTPAEEISWLRSKIEECQNEFQEFQESSRDLEAEYETQIKQLEKKNNDTLHQYNRLDLEYEQLKSKYSTYTNESQQKLSSFQQQINDLSAMNERLTTYIRELEQSNDDLERARRTLAASLGDFEAQLNQQIERNVLLENEVSEKEELECVVQRLKDEARDLRHELIVNKNSADSTKRKQLLMDASLQSLDLNQSDSIASPKIYETNDMSQFSSDQELGLLSNSMLSNGEKACPNIDSTTSPQTPPATSSRFSNLFSNTSSALSRITTETKSQQTSSPSSPTLPSLVMTPSSRASALNIVSDLLRKVGALEAKIASAKKVAS